MTESTTYSTISWSIRHKFKMKLCNLKLLAVSMETINIFNIQYKYFVSMCILCLGLSIFNQICDGPITHHPPPPPAPCNAWHFYLSFTLFNISWSLLSDSLHVEKTWIFYFDKFPKTVTAVQSLSRETSRVNKATFKQKLRWNKSTFLTS